MLALVLVDGADEAFSSLPVGALPSIRADLGLSYAQASALLVIPSAGTLLGNAAMVAVDFVSRRVLAVAGAITYAACLAVFGLSDSFLTVAIAAFLLGAASDAFVLGAHVALCDLAAEHLEPTLAVSNFLGALGAALAPVAVAVADGTGVGWRPLMVGAGVLMLGYGAWLARQPLPGPAADDDSTPLRAWLETIRDRSVLKLAATEGMWDALGSAFLGFFAIVLVSHHGVARSTAALVVAAALGAQLATFAFVAIRPTAHAPESLLRIASLVQLVSTIGLAVTGSLAVVMPLAFAFGAAGALFWIGIQTSVVSLRPDRIGTVWAVIAIVSLPTLAVPPLIGALADRFGPELGMASFVVVAMSVVALTSTRSRRGARRLGSRG